MITREQATLVWTRRAKRRSALMKQGSQKSRNVLARRRHERKGGVSQVAAAAATGDVRPHVRVVNPEQGAWRGDAGTRLDTICLLCRSVMIETDKHAAPRAMFAFDRTLLPVIALS